MIHKVKDSLKCFDKINTPAFAQFQLGSAQDSADDGEGDAAEDGGGVLGVTGVAGGGGGKD